jgi:ribosomal protein S19
MKIPFVDYNLYIEVMMQPTAQNNDGNSIESDNFVIQTTSRSSTITSGFVGKVLAVHSGNKSKQVLITSDMIGHKLGSFSFTKKLGKSIHNSEHNRKKIAKMKRKITQKKVRKTPAKTTKTSSAKKK